MAAKAKAPPVPGAIVHANGSLRVTRLGPSDLVVGEGHVLDIQRARILAAMVEECAERGVANVSVAHVVGRAGVSRRTFYEIFSDSEDCFLRAFDEGIARASRYVLASYDPSAGWAERLRTGLLGLLAFLDVERDVGRLLIVSSLGAGASALERRRRVLPQIIALVDEGRLHSRTGNDLPPLTAEGIVGGVLSVLHARLLDDDSSRLVELAGPLMSMIVLPYLGPAAARREYARPAPAAPRILESIAPDPLRQLGMRLTYRTVRVLLAVAATPGGSNRQVADGSGIGDQGQISKLLARLHRLGLIENTGAPTTRGAPNAWVLTDRGWEVQAVLVAR
jgi:AcrR family transcriptional regulator/DNA-binding MarR family transcriptional regulator